MIRTPAIVLILALIGSACAARLTEQEEQDIKIMVDDSAARYVLADPVRAVQERDAIWDKYEGYRITLVWHEKSSVPVTWEIWDRGLDRFINRDTSLTRKSRELSNGLRGLEKREHEKIVQHLSVYLPTTASYDAYVYLVAFTTPYAFCVEQNKIGIDITADEWYFDPEFVFNMMIHELYHVGYKLNSPDREYINADPTNGDEFIRFNYAYMLSEGMATYVAYKAVDLFPSDYEHEDYKLLADSQSVKKAIDDVNKLLGMAKTETIDALLKEAWDVGVIARAYYIAGANVCKTIEEKYGSQYLADLVSKGGRELTKEYNALVPDDLKISLL